MMFNINFSESIFPDVLLGNGRHCINVLYYLEATIKSLKTFSWINGKFNFHKLNYRFPHAVLNSNKNRTEKKLNFSL